MGEAAGSGAVSTESTSARGRGWLVWVAVGVVVVLVAGVVAVVVSRGSSASAAVRLVPAGSVGDDPFTDSVQVGRVGAFPGNVEAIAATTRRSFGSQGGVLLASGTKPGLYGGSGDVHVCDPVKLVEFLGANPAKAKAWASVLGISPAQIKTYVEGLTPVVLVQDTLVGNHGYRDGKATYETSVLQAGTSVMVDSSGVPRVKCNCGNPLTAPQVLSPPTHTTGAPWSGYDPTHVTSVAPGAPAPGGLTGISILTGDPVTIPIAGTTTNRWVSIEKPTGSSGSATVVASSDGRTWTPAGIIPADLEVSALAYGGGRWVAMAQSFAAGQTSTEIYTSTNLRSWSADPTLPADLTAVAYGGGRWTAVGPQVGTTTGYTSTDGLTWTPLDQLFASEGPPSVAYGGGQWLVAQTSSNSPMGTSIVNDTWFETSRDGVHWTDGANVGDIAASVAFGGGTWVLAGGPGTGATTSTYTSTDGTTWTPASVADGALDNYGFSAYGTSSWLMVSTAGQQGRTDVYASPNGLAWSSVVTTAELDPVLAYGPAGGSSASPSSPTTSSSTTTSIASGTAAGPCTAATFQATLPAGQHLDSFSCSGSWAVIIADNSQDEFTQLAQWSGSSWATVDRTGPCQANTVPSTIYQEACQTN